MKVFLSYAHQDHELAKCVREALEEEGLEVFDAQSDILPGDNWAHIIGEALEQAEAMVILITQNAIRSPYVTREIQHALRHQAFEGRVIPLVVESSEALSETDIPWILNKLHTVHWKPEDSAPLHRVARTLLQAA